MGAQVALRKMLALSPAPKVIIVTVFADQRLVQELLALGAAAYLSKSASIGDLLNTVHAVARGGSEANVILSVPRTSLETADADEAENELTGREAEILLHAARGESNRQVAEALYISETTVKRHLTNVYSKLGVSSRTEATRRAISEGWISAWDISQTSD